MPNCQAGCSRYLAPRQPVYSEEKLQQQDFYSVGVAVKKANEVVDRRERLIVLRTENLTPASIAERRRSATSCPAADLVPEKRHTEPGLCTAHANDAMAHSGIEAACQ
jgi:hypothetical protein